MIRLANARLAAASLGAMALSGCGGSATEGGGEGFAFPPTAVEVARVEVGRVANTFQTVGSIEADESVTIVSEIDGAVKRLPFREGGPIARGELIAQLDDAERAADLARAEAVLGQRRSSHDRIRRVVEQGAAAAQDLDDAASALQVAEADVALVRARLTKTRITAPFSGVVGRREVSPGAFVRAGQVITKLASIAELKVVFSVPERHARVVRRGADVVVSTPAHPGYELTGKIDVVDPILDPQNRSLRVIARVANPDSRLLPGMSASVRAVLSERDSAMTIPSEAVFAEGGDFLAYVVQPDSTVARAVLKLGTRLSGSVEVTSGVSEGDLVVRAGHQKLFPGAKVMAVNSDAPAEPGVSPGEGTMP